MEDVTDTWATLGRSHDPLWQRPSLDWGFFLRRCPTTAASKGHDVCRYLLVASIGIIFSWDVQALCISKTCGPCSLLFAPRPLRPRLTPSTHNTIISHAKHSNPTSRWPQSRASLIPRTWYGSTKCCACSYKHANLLTVGVPPPRSHWSQGLRPISGRLVDLWRYTEGQCCQGLYGGCMGGYHAHRQ